MDVGFVILCPERNIGGLKNTLGSIRFHSYNRDSICVVGKDTTSTELADMNKFAPTFKGEDTITSLINIGMKKIKHDWACILFSGSRIPAYIEKKIAVWAGSESDVLFPVVDRKWEFSEGSFNGVVINTKFFAKVGDFPAVAMMKAGLNDFEFAKMLWAMQAAEHGCKFKAIVGMRII